MLTDGGRSVGVLVANAVGGDGVAAQGQNFVIPASEVLDMLARNGVTPRESDTSATYSKAIDEFYAEHYRAALPLFEKADTLYPAHPFAQGSSRTARPRSTRVATRRRCEGLGDQLRPSRQARRWARGSAPRRRAGRLAGDPPPAAGQCRSRGGEGVVVPGPRPRRHRPVSRHRRRPGTAGTWAPAAHPTHRTSRCPRRGRPSRAASPLPLRQLPPLP
ncbi:MAG: hypothetical protein R2734_04090 [Nocardioides sp.]